MPMADILNPLAVFCSQPRSQRYTKRIQNLGDAWRTFSEAPSTETDVIIETTFDFTLKIKTEQNENISSVEMAMSGEHETVFAPDPVHHWRIFFGYGTDFIWRNYDGIEYEKEGSAAELDELIGSYSPSVVEHYDA